MHRGGIWGHRMEDVQWVSFSRCYILSSFRQSVTYYVNLTRLSRNWLLRLDKIRKFDLQAPIMIPLSVRPRSKHNIAMDQQLAIWKGIWFRPDAIISTLLQHYFGYTVSLMKSILAIIIKRSLYMDKSLAGNIFFYQSCFQQLQHAVIW